MNDKIIRKFIQANNKTTRDFVVQKMTPELKELIRTWVLSESVEEEKSQQNYIEKHKSTGTNRKCSGLMGIGRQNLSILDPKNSWRGFLMKVLPKIMLWPMTDGAKRLLKNMEVFIQDLTG